MNIWILFIVFNIAVLWLCLLFVVLIRIRFKMFEKNMIQNTTKLLDKLDSKKKQEVYKMDKDLVNAVKYIKKEMDKMKEEILESIENISVEEAEEEFPLEEDEGTDSLFEEVEEDIEDYKGERKVDTPPEEPKEKKGFFGKKKGRPKKVK